MTQYAKEYPPKFLSEYAYRQFEIACEHKLFFAVFDSLISMCWDAKNNTFLNKEKAKFKKNIMDFLIGYIAYSKEPSIVCLKRLAREFLFDWESIKKNVKNSNSPQLLELYQELIDY